MNDPFEQLLELSQRFKKENNAVFSQEAKTAITMFLVWAQTRFDYNDKKEVKNGSSSTLE